MAVKQWKLDTWLKRAVLEDDIDDARRALDAGGNCNQSVEVNGVNSTLLIQAVFKHIALMQLLLDHGADVHGRDWKGSTALHYAWRPEIIIMLLNSGADPNARTIENDTPLHFCTIVKNARLLIDAGADPTLKNDLEQLPWQCVEMRISSNEHLIGGYAAFINSSQEAIDLLRALAEQDELTDATTPVQMTQKEETEKALGGRF